MKRLTPFFFTLAFFTLFQSTIVVSDETQLIGVFGASGRTGTHIIEELKKRDVGSRRN